VPCIIQRASSGLTQNIRLTSNDFEEFFRTKTLIILNLYIIKTCILTNLRKWSSVFSFLTILSHVEVDLHDIEVSPDLAPCKSRPLMYHKR